MKGELFGSQKILNVIFKRIFLSLVVQSTLGVLVKNIKWQMINQD